MKVKILAILLLGFNTMFSQVISEDVTLLLEQDSSKAQESLYKAMMLHQQLEASLPPEQKERYLKEVEYYLNRSLRFDTTQNFNDIFRELAQMYFFTGVELFNKGSYRASLDAFEKNIEFLSRPNISDLDTIVLFNTAIAAEKAGQFEKAEKYYHQIISYNYDSWQMYVAFAGMYKSQFKDRLFFKTLNIGVQKYPDQQMAYKNELLAYYLERERYDSALVYIDEFLKTDAQNAKLYYLKGSSLHQLNRVEEAQVYYKKCLNIEPNNVDAAYNISSILFNKVRLITQKKKLSKSEKINLKSLSLEGLDYLKRVQKQEPDNVEVLKMMLVFYKNLNDKKHQKEVSMMIKSLSN